MILDAEAISELELRSKVQLATSLPGVKPACLIGTINAAGQENLALFSSVTHFGSSPLLLGMVTRPDTVERHTLSNILETQQWTLSHIHAEILSAAHQCSAKYPREQSEFEATGLTPVYPVAGFHAPAVKEARLTVGLRLNSILDIPANGTKLILGEVAWVSLPEAVLAESGHLDFAQLGTLGSTALDTYFTVQELAQLPYARP